MTEPFATHEVFNQSPPLIDINLYDSDEALRRAVASAGAQDHAAELSAFGAVAGSAEAAQWARQANESTPVLATYDSKGYRCDRVDFHPAYHALMATSFRHGVHLLEDHRAAHAVRAAKLYLAAQMEPGHCCPITMTNAARPVLERAGAAGEAWLQKTRAHVYDPAFRPMPEKASVTIGMGMTEKQGGSDVRANTTAAAPEGARGSGAAYRIRGHKWFMSAPMSDAFLVLAQAEGGLSSFLLPRFRPDSSINALRFERLKPKLGNRSNASSEVEFHDAHALLIGEEGEGTRVIIQMVTLTRLDCAASSAGFMRQALAHAIHHAEHRAAFQKKLVDQPAMQQVLADMALDVEAAVALTFRLAKAFGGDDPRDLAWRRLMTPVVKYWVCKTAPPLAGEAMECLGGNGYVEDGVMARLYREAPVNSIWEGSGNIMALDFVQASARAPEACAALLADLAEGCRNEPVLQAALSGIAAELRAPGQVAPRALADRLALIAAAALLRRQGPQDVADAFICHRLGPQVQRTYGAAVAGAREIIARASPEAVRGR